MAGTQLRCANETGPMSIGENRRDAAASAADGARPAEALKRFRCGGRHTVFAPRHSGRRRNHLSTQLLIYHAGRLHGCGSARRLPWARRAYSYGARRGPLHGFSRATRAAPVAQLDRAPDYESGGQEFESLRARQLNQKLRMILPIDPEAICLSRVHNQVHDRAASARGLVSNGPLSLPREFLRSYLAWGCS
jgi:hypothetical protein